ncbi:MAG: hypothetical protein J7527_18685 [Chitinophagaceae bacterium]|nr:hypothetical protein [Chitinophagaceae bacterium]
MKYVLYFLLAWFLYNFIFKFAIPVYRASRQMKKQFRQMQENMQQHVNQQQANNGYQAQQPQGNTSKPKPAGDYIDFEEIK